MIWIPVLYWYISIEISLFKQQAIMYSALHFM